MRKILAVTLVLVFTCALLFALGCTKKTEQTGMEAEQGMEQTTPGMDSMSTTTTTTTTTTTDTTHTGP